MNRIGRHTLFGLMLALTLLAACGGGQPAPQASDPGDRVGTRVAEERAVAATLTALASDTGSAATAAPAAIATLTPTAEVAPDFSPTFTLQPPTETPTAPSCRVVAAGLNLRGGPGLVFAPPIAGLARDAELQPLSFVAQGFPSGQWIEVQVVTTGRKGWVSAGAQFVACNVDVTRLPKGVSPPTPTPTRVVVTVVPVFTPTRVLVVVVPVDGGDENGNIRNNRGVNGGNNILLPGYTGATNPVRFKDRIVFQVEVFDRTVGQYDGAGIQDVEFFISDDFGRVHERIERNAGYCVFGGGEPDCTVWRFSEHNNRWPNGAELHKGFHDVQIIITAQNGQRINWNWSFVIE